MKITVLFFGKLFDATEVASLFVECEPTCTVRQIMQQLQQQYPKLEATVAGTQIKIAVNQELCDLNTELSAGDELAFLPPVTGG